MNFIIDHQLESVDAFDAILLIIIALHIFNELSTYVPFMPQNEIQEHLVFTLSLYFSVCKGHNWFSYKTLCKIYCQSSRRLSVSEISLPCDIVVHINHVIACFVQASDD